MAETSEPMLTQDSKPESVLQASTLAEIKALLSKRQQHQRVPALLAFSLLEGFGLDIAVFTSWSNGHCGVKLLELKAFAGARPSGVGIGSQSGEGTQIELLLLDSVQLAVVDQCVRWILGNFTRPLGSARFVTFTSTRAAEIVMNGVQRGKQNNLNVAKLKADYMTWDGLSAQLEVFLTEV